MKSSNSQIQQLRSLLSLEEKRAKLQEELSSLSQKIEGLQRQLLPGGRTAASNATATAATTSSPSPSRSTPRPRSGGGGKSAKPAKAGRGELKSRIFSALEQAGSSGVRVLDLARSLDTNPANIYAWFHAAVKRYPQIKKVGSAEYRLGNGGAKSTTKDKAKGAKPQAATGAPAGAKRGARAGSRRGALQEKIIGALKSSGSRGITVKELSERFGIPYRNVQVWFATTGKKQPGIRKVAPATYRYAG